MNETLRVLLFAHHPDVGPRVRHELRRSGFEAEVFEATSDDAFRAALAAGADLVLSDCASNDVDPLNTISIAREIGPGIPFVVVDAGSHAKHAVTAFRNGVADYLFAGELSHLGRVVERLLREGATASSSAARLSLIFRSSPIAMALSEMDTSTLLEINDRFLHYFGYPREKLIGRRAVLIGIWENEADRDRLLARLRSGDAIRDEEVTFVTRSGERCYLQLSMELFDLDGTDCVLWMGVDVSEKKQTEKELLRERAFLDTVFENVPIPVFVKNAEDLTFVRLNKSAGELLGRPRDELLGKTAHEFFPKPEADFIAAKDREALDEGKLIDVPEEIIQTNHLGRRVLHTRKIPIGGGPGERPSHLLGISEDITEQTRYEQALMDVVRETEKMNRLKGAFIRNMSHEMRTPLTGIIGLADFLAEEVEGAHREHIRLIRSSGERLLELMDSVLDLSMLESETFRLNPERIDVAETLRAVAESIRPLAERKGLFLKVEGAAESVQATLDRSYVERILKKLIGNAVKFTEKGGIALSLSAEDGRVSITVSDTGIGIGKAFRPSLFEAFEQESSGKTRSHEGSGLGLALTKRMVEVMGGTIHLTSKKSRGSTFTVSFPTENPAAPESNTGESAAAN